MTSLDPYQPPQVPFEPRKMAADADDFRNYPQASRRARVFNLLFDYAGVIVLSGVVFAFIEAGSPGFIDNLDETEERIFGVGIMLVYYICFEGLFGWTPGKLATGTRVISMRDGDAATIKQVIARSFSRFVPFEPFSFFSSTGGWHDNWSGTGVVQVRGVVRAESRR